jgi:hypothetical protein
MKWLFALIAMFAAMASRADEKPNPAALTAKEIGDGWISLFDGESTFGWKAGGDVFINEKKSLVLQPGNRAKVATTTTLGNGELRLVYSRVGPGFTTVLWPDGAQGLHSKVSGRTESETIEIKMPKQGPIELMVTEKAGLALKLAAFRPSGMTHLFNGKNLDGWKQFTENPKQAKSKFSVTPEGWLNVKDGPGDLQTEKQFADFVFQAECISNGKHLNSGIFFRALPGQYQQGYEAQIHNGFKDGDRSKPMDYGTGAIYRRQPARKVVPNDHEWFTMTVVAHGNHIATWVNGYQVVDFTDTRPANENARSGSKTTSGAISIQGHDPTTDLSFRNIRIAELPKKN